MQFSREHNSYLIDYTSTIIHLNRIKLHLNRWLIWYQYLRKEFYKGYIQHFVLTTKNQDEISTVTDKVKKITKRTRLENKFVKSRKYDDHKSNSKQRNYCAKYLRKTKQSYYENLDEQITPITENFGKQLNRC